MMMFEEQEMIGEAWEQNRKDYYEEIALLNEVPSTKINLRNLADWAVDIAVKAATARRLNHRLSAAIYQGVGRPDDVDYTGKYTFHRKRLLLSVSVYWIISGVILDLVGCECSRLGFT